MNLGEKENRLMNVSLNNKIAFYVDGEDTNIEKPSEVKEKETSSRQSKFFFMN